MACRFSVDQKPIRTVRKTSSRYPSSPMTVAVSIWDASQWATGPRDARIPINYDYAVRAYNIMMCLAPSYSPRQVRDARLTACNPVCQTCSCIFAASCCAK